MSVSIQSSNGTSVLNDNGNIHIRGSIKTLKVNGETIGKSKSFHEKSYQFLYGFIVGTIVAGSLLLTML